MRGFLIKVISIQLLLLILWACAKVPITGRRQMNLLPESELMTMSLDQYNQFLSEHKKVPDTDPRTQMVKRVGKKIADAVTEFSKDNKKMQKRIKNFEWEFNLVEDNIANAWCMPGGKVCFYTGILPITADETGLAVVMGHEIAHAIARHGNERMSQGLAMQAGGATIGAVMGSNPTLGNQIFMQAIGVGGQLGMLKFSRKHESEADHMGLIFMAMAGYDPREAASFWERMKEAGGGAPPEFLSTHPSHDSRIEDIKDHLPEAMTYYNPSK